MIKINDIDYNITLYDEGEEDDGYMYETYTLEIEGKIIEVEFLYHDIWSEDPLWNRLGLPDLMTVKSPDTYYVQATEDDENNVIFKMWDFLRKLTETCAELENGEIPCSVEVRNLNDWNDGWDCYQTEFAVSQASLQAWEKAHAC